MKMEERINIAEILKNCPKGMELDCAIYNGVTLDSVVFESEYHYENTNTYPIKIVTKNGFSTRLTKYGQNVDISEAKCVIFPKGKKTWEGFQRPFKDGDIIAFDSEMGTQLFIFKEYIREPNYVQCYMMLDYDGATDFESCDYYVERFATEEEKQKLFDAIRANGYRWNAETKTLEKLIIPKFKVGDIITNGKTFIAIDYIDDEYYYEISRDIAHRLCIKNQNEWELVPNKFDITTFKPFDKVLVRCSSLEKWRIQFFEKFDKTCKFPFICMGYNKYTQCIPYEGNEHLLDTADSCSDYYQI